MKREDNIALWIMVVLLSVLFGLVECVRNNPSPLAKAITEGLESNQP